MYERIPRAASDFERAGKTITQTRLYSFMAVVRNDMAAGGPADLCIARTTFHRLRYTGIYICTYIHAHLCTCTHTFTRAYTFMQNSSLCTPPFFTCVRVYVYVRTHAYTQLKRIRSRVCTKTGFIVLSTNVHVYIHSRLKFYS